MTPIPLGILDFPTGAAGAYDLLETQVLASSAASVTFTGLDTLAAGYQHLQVRSVQRSDNAVDNISNVNLRFNSDTGANYAFHWLEGDGSSVDSADFSSQTLIAIRRAIPRDGATADSFGASVIDILDFSSSTKNTTTRALAGVNTASNSNIALSSGLWADTDAVTAITLTSASGNFKTASRFSLYGIKGA